MLILSFNTPENYKINLNCWLFISKR